MHVMPILILPPRQTPDAQAIRAAAAEAGWHVEQLTSWRAPRALRGQEVVLYGEPLFADVVSPTLGLALLEPPLDWLPTLPPAYRQRAVQLTTLASVKDAREPSFIKPTDDKCFPAAVYPSGRDLPATVHLLPDTTPVLVAEPVRWEVEFRCFVHERTVVSLSPYLRHGVLARAADGSWLASPEERAEAHAYATRVVEDAQVRLPPAVVVDVGKIPEHGWAVVEANAAWGSGIYGCEARPLLPVLQRASRRSEVLTPDEREWVRPWYVVESDEPISDRGGDE